MREDYLNYYLLDHTTQHRDQMIRSAGAWSHYAQVLEKLSFRTLHNYGTT